MDDSFFQEFTASSTKCLAVNSLSRCVGSFIKQRSLCQMLWGLERHDTRSYYFLMLTWFKGNTFSLASLIGKHILSELLDTGYSFKIQSKRNEFFEIKHNAVLIKRKYYWLIKIENLKANRQVPTVLLTKSQLKNNKYLREKSNLIGEK